MSVDFDENKTAYNSDICMLANRWVFLCPCDCSTFALFSWCSLVTFVDRYTLAFANNWHECAQIHNTNSFCKAFARICICGHRQFNINIRSHIRAPSCKHHTVNHLMGECCHSVEYLYGFFSFNHSIIIWK